MLVPSPIITSSSITVYGPMVTLLPIVTLSPIIALEWILLEMNILLNDLQDLPKV